MTTLRSPLFLAVLGLALALGPVLPARATAASDAADRLDIQAAYDQISAAFQRGDMDGLMAHFTPDYTEQQQRGATVNRAEARRQYQGHRAQITFMSSRWTLQDLRPTAGGVSVQMTMHSSGNGIKRILFAKVRGTFTDDLCVRDFWIHTALGWRIKHRVVLAEQTHTHPG